MQQIYNGIEKLSEVVGISNKIMLVCDSSFHFLNIKKDIEDKLHKYVVFNQFSSNPLYEDVCKGVDLFNEESCDTLVAVGGGSAIDVAKCIKLYCKMQKGKLYLEQEYNDTGIKLIAIPTTAGTGSESTRYAVIYYEGKKQSVTHESIIPDVAILEPKVLKTLPLYQKKSTMLDALCQGIESWWSVNSTDKSKELSKKAVELITENWKAYIQQNDDKAAASIMKAANLAGQAICITQTTAAHAFSYKITSLYKMPHGHAVAVCLPYIWEYMLRPECDCIDHRGRNYLNCIFEEISKALNCDSVKIAIDSWHNMLSEMEMCPPQSRDKAKDIKILAKSVNPIRLRNNPVALDSKIIESLYNQIIV